MNNITQEFNSKATKILQFLIEKRQLSLLTLKMLKKKNADFNTKTIHEETALLSAVIDGKKDMVEFLLENGANPNISKTNNMSPLLIASVEGFTDIAKSLIEKKANLNIQGGIKKETALMISMQKGHVELAKLLINSGAKTELKNIDGKTAYELTSEPSHNPELSAKKWEIIAFLETTKKEQLQKKLNEANKKIARYEEVLKAKKQKQEQTPKNTNQHGGGGRIEF